MTDLPTSVERALDHHDAFEPTGEGYELTTTVFDATVSADDAGDAGDRFRVVVSLPTLDAAVAGETVPDVVEDGWYETLERRLADTFRVADADAHDDPVLERDAERVRVVLEYVSPDAGEGVADAKTLVEYVEGTYAQGIVPGYEYRGPAAALLENARQRGQRASDESPETLR